MRDVITVELGEKEIYRFKKKLEDTEAWLEEKAKLLAERLAETADMKISIKFAAAGGPFAPEGRFQVETTWENDHTAVVRASGTEVLFIEFGSGIRFASQGHPEAAQNGMGPGTYPGKGHWDNPRGWWFYNSQGELEHSFGNPAMAPVYESLREIEQDDINRIVKEVFND